METIDVVGCIIVAAIISVGITCPVTHYCVNQSWRNETVAREYADYVIKQDGDREYSEWEWK